MHKSLDRVRQYVAASLGEVDASKHSLSWVTGDLFPPAHELCKFRCNANLHARMHLQGSREVCIATSSPVYIMPWQVLHARNFSPSSGGESSM